jgi:putative endonuclease
MPVRNQLLRRLWFGLFLSPVLTRWYDRIGGNPRSLGARGEREAERFYLRQGLIVIERGFQDQFGEIDLIVVDGRRLVFVEVKTRATDRFGSPAEAVDEEKQRRITKTAYAFLKRHQLTENPIRFDIVSIVWPADQATPAIKQYANAFEAWGEFQLY